MGTMVAPLNTLVQLSLGVNPDQVGRETDFSPYMWEYSIKIWKSSTRNLPWRRAWFKVMFPLQQYQVNVMLIHLVNKFQAYLGTLDIRQVCWTRLLNMLKENPTNVNLNVMER